MQFSKYHGLGNDYIVIEPHNLPDITPDQIRRICDRHYGVGADGILYGALGSATCDFGLRIYNPDGSEAEKSGNGLRIFARYLWDHGLVNEQAFRVETLGGAVTCQVAPDGKSVQVGMGRVVFNSGAIPVLGDEREVLNETLITEDRTWRFCAASVGNPHCVVVCDAMPSVADVQQYGRLIEHHALFPKKINVQFMTVLDRTTIQIEIWERGAGYTLASGSSSTAAAAIAHKLGLCDSQINVVMPGGVIQLAFDHHFAATMTGAVSKVCEGTIAAEVFEQL